MAESVEISDLQSRKYHCELGILSRPDGSAILSQNGTIMIAAIYGPLEAKPQKLLIEKSLVEAHYRPKAGLPGVNDRLKESMIRNTCETALMAILYPRTSISVVIQEVQNCGEIIACAVNAACFALLHSGIEMKFLVGAITCILDKNNEIIVNPNHLLIDKAKTTFTFVFDSINRNIVASHTSGIFSDEQLKDAVAKCRQESEHLFNYYRQMISQEIYKEREVDK